jgi:hypothetical protein
MSLYTGDLGFYYPLNQPEIEDLESPIGGAINSGNPYVFSAQGIAPLINSPVAGAGSVSYYGKLFLKHGGMSGDILSNIQFYISNETVSDQVEIALDPYWTAIHDAQTGQSDNRLSVPDEVASFDYYDAESPLVVNDIADASRTPVTIDSGDSIGIWVKISVPAGLSSSYANSFNIVVRGEA